MKKTFLALAAFVLCTIAAHAQSIGVYLSDSKGPYTNIRNAPGGAIVDKLPVNEDFIFVVEEPRNGWWKIQDGVCEPMDGDAKKLKGSRNGYWIHYSVIGVSTSNYGGERLSLRQSPSSKATVVYSFKEEILLRPLDAKGEWVKVKTKDGKLTGWIEMEWLCGNPVTNCC